VETIEKPIPFAIPDLDGSELEEISDALRSGWVTTGPKTKQFEKEFADFVGAKHAIAVNSCTAAMHLALEAMGLHRGDEVITTPYTFAATAEVIRYFHAKPVFVDVDPVYLNINPDLIEREITPKTKAIMPVHLAGLPAEMDAIREVATRHGIPVIEDSAHAFPASYKGKKVGSISEFTCFSFYATKSITTGEGGMITTDNPEWAERCRVMSLHGINKDAWKRYTAEGKWYYEIIAPGYKYNMTDIAAAMGLAQLRKAERMRERRKAIAMRYHEAFRPFDAVQLPADRPDCEHAWHLYMLRLHLHHFIDRAHVMEQLRLGGIGASVHFIPLHMHPYYKQTFQLKPQDFPVARAEYLREISLPIYSRMSDEDVERVISVMIGVLGAHGC
jgi:dTDP-4-amino-4,6-dideoxygalactose transaminase